MTLDMLKAGTTPPPPPPLSARRSNAAALAAGTPAGTPGSVLARRGSGGGAYFDSANGSATHGDGDATLVALEAGGHEVYDPIPNPGISPTLASAFSAEAPEELPIVERVPGTAPMLDDSPGQPGSARAPLSRPSSGRPGSARRSSLFRRSPATPDRGRGVPAGAAAAELAGPQGRHVSFDGMNSITPAASPARH